MGSDSVSLDDLFDKFLVSDILPPHEDSGTDPPLLLLDSTPSFRHRENTNSVLTGEGLKTSDYFEHKRKIMERPM